MRTPRLTAAQFKFLDAWVPTQRHWMQASGCAIGAVASTRRERRTLAALIRNGFVAENGQATDAGMRAYDRKVARISA